jgi:hypothetical protein
MIVNADQLVKIRLSVITDRSFFLQEFEPILFEQAHQFTELHRVSLSSETHTRQRVRKVARTADLFWQKSELDELSLINDKSVVRCERIGDVQYVVPAGRG